MNKKTEKGMGRVLTLMENGSGKETSMKVNTRTGNFMVKEHTLHLMGISMKENGRRG